MKFFMKRKNNLYPAILPCLLNVNVASRKDMGTKKGLQLMNKFIRNCKIQYKKYYILKCDISKFFSSINHDILKEKILKRIKDKDAIKIIFDIIDSYSPGLGIGSMTSQVLAIFYLNDLDYFIKETLKIKYYVRYQDDFLLFHPSKEYLKYIFFIVFTIFTVLISSTSLIMGTLVRPQGPDMSYPLPFKTFTLSYSTENPSIVFPVMSLELRETTGKSPQKPPSP